MGWHLLKLPVREEAEMQSSGASLLYVMQTASWKGMAKRRVAYLQAGLRLGSVPVVCRESKRYRSPDL